MFTCPWPPRAFPRHIFNDPMEKSGRVMLTLVAREPFLVNLRSSTGWISKLKIRRQTRTLMALGVGPVRVASATLGLAIGLDHALLKSDVEL
jgi:hypothetical protein